MDLLKEKQGLNMQHDVVFSVSCTGTPSQSSVISKGIFPEAHL
jgi:hypothetical protein